MNYLLRFLLLYFIIVIALLSFYFNANKENIRQLEITNQQIDGTLYIQNIYHLGIDLVELNNLYIQPNTEASIDTLKADIRADIDGIFMMQKFFPIFKSESYNKQLQKIKK